MYSGRMVSTAAWHHHTPRQLAARLAELASLRVKFKLKIGAMAKKDEIGKEENRETKIRIDQGIFNHKGRKMTRRRGGTDETLESGKIGKLRRVAR